MDAGEWTKVPIPNRSRCIRTGYLSEVCSVLHIDLVEWRVPLHSLMLGCNTGRELSTVFGDRGPWRPGMPVSRFAVFITHNAT